ncbi:MAG: hypothetical protein ACPLRY_06605 [Candidatus Bathyarchaeales archaeon]
MEGDGQTQKKNSVTAEHVLFHLALLGSRERYHLTAKNHSTGDVKNAWLAKEEVLQWVEARNTEGFTCWISLNDKEFGNDTIKGVCALCDFWLDVDSKRLDKNKPATREELGEALKRAVKLKEYIEVTYGAEVFLALSGNGFHLHAPLPYFGLVGEKFREEVNEKVKSFAKRLAAFVGVEIDRTYDIRRVTTVIGSLNLKIPNTPLETRWYKEIFAMGFEAALAKAEEAKQRNRKLLEAILNEPIAKPLTQSSEVKNPPKFEDLLSKDEKLRDLYNGDWQKYGYKSRSEAEEALVVKLVFYGFGDNDIKQIMEGSSIGKWQEKTESYKDLTIRKAREYFEQHRGEVEEEEKAPMQLIEEELEKQAAVRLHPLMDYHPKVGFSLGMFPLGVQKSLIFLAEKPFVTNSNTLQLQHLQPILINVKKPKWAKLHENHAYVLLQLAREHFEKGRIEFPAKNEVFFEVSGKIYYYWWHSDRRYYLLVACWVIGTYFHRLFAFYPALNPQGQRQTGKTTLLDIVTQCAWNPTGRETAVREADLFRTIEGARGTYILDITMLDKSKDTKDVIDVIETGTEIGGCVRRIHPKTGKPMEFETYGPKAIATRYELPFVAKCIRIITEQAPSPEYAKRRALIPFDKDWMRVKELLVKAAIKYWREVKEAYDGLEQTDKLCGRAFNYWAPLLAVCKVFAPEQFQELLSLAEEDAERAEKGDRLSEVEAAVLAVLSEFKGEKEEQKTVTVLLKELTQQVQNLVPWVKDWHIVVSALENLGVAQRKYQTSKGVQYQINLEKVKKEAENRKLKANEEQKEQPNVLTQENVERVYEALAEASKERGSATTEEVALEAKLPLETVKAVLEALQREGRAFSPYPEWWKVV